MCARKSVKTRAKQGQNVEEGSKEKCWRVKKGGHNFEKRQTKRERGKQDTVSRGGLLEVGIGEMIGGADLVRGDQGPPRNRVWFDQMTLKEGQRVGDRRKQK
jgi:hypothetical protein